MRTTLALGCLGCDLVTDLWPSVHLPRQALPAEGGGYLDPRIYLALLSQPLCFCQILVLMKHQYARSKNEAFFTTMWYRLFSSG